MNANARILRFRKHSVSALACLVFAAINLPTIEGCRFERARLDDNVALLLEDNFHMVRSKLRRRPVAITLPERLAMHGVQSSLHIIHSMEDMQGKIIRGRLGKKTKEQSALRCYPQSASEGMLSRGSYAFASTSCPFEEGYLRQPRRSRGSYAFASTS